MKKAKINIFRGEVTYIKGEIYEDAEVADLDQNDFEDVSTKTPKEVVNEPVTEGTEKQPEGTEEGTQYVTPETTVETKVKKAKK